MMNKAAERDILGLIPSITLPIPRELLETTVSLFSQSKSKASSLKQDEEIARGYVCANIACNRLKSRLNLPTIVVRPPVAPKIYKKLYAYLDSALSARATPKKIEEPTTPRKPRVQSTNTTPSKSRPTPSRTPATRPSTGKRKRDGDGHEVPEWVMPAIRTLCKLFKIPAAAPHVFVGVTSILGVIWGQQSALSATPSKRRSKQVVEAPSEAVAKFEDEHISALIAVVALYTASHLLGAPSPQVYEKQREKAIECLLRATPEEYKQGDEDMVSTVEVMLREAQNGWLDMEWFENLPEADTAGGGEKGDVSADDDAGEEEDKEGGVELPKRGFGTMMTDATDWLSEDRRKEYKRWKADIIKRIALIERAEKGKGRSVRV